MKKKEKFLCTSKQTSKQEKQEDNYLCSNKQAKMCNEEALTGGVCVTIFDQWNNTGDEAISTQKCAMERH